MYQIYSKMTINWGTIQALENNFYTKVSRIKRLTASKLGLAHEEMALSARFVLSG